MGSKGELVSYLPSTTSSAIGVLVLYLCYHIFRVYWKLRDFPGPFWAKFTDVQRVYWVKTKRAQEIHQEAHNKFGDVVRFGPNMVSLADPALIPAVYPMRPGFPKSKFYRSFMPYSSKGGSLQGLFTTQDEQLHKLLKSPVAPIYSLSNVMTFERFIDEVSEILFKQLDERFADSLVTFDLADWLHYYSFDVMGTLSFSKRYGFLENGKDVNGLIEAVWSFWKTIAPMSQIPWFDRIWYKSFVAVLLKNRLASPILAIVVKNIDERQRDSIAVEKKKNIGDRDLLSRFLEIQGANQAIPEWAAKSWTMSNVIAGSDSSSAVLNTILYRLLTDARSLRKLQDELRETEKTTGLTMPFPRWKEVKDLPYLDACVQEALRIDPPFTLPLEREVPAGGLTIGGSYYPEGTVVGMNPYVINRHRPTFGEDADSWRPERWLVDKDEHRRKLEGSLLTFGAGRRVCSGKYIALLEIKKLIPALLLNYEIEFPDPSTFSAEQSYFSRQKGLNVRIKKIVTA